MILIQEILLGKKDCVTRKDTQIETLTYSYGVSHFISNPTHILRNSSSLKNSSIRTDSVFTNKPNFSIDSGVYPSLHLNCHHQIAFLKTD